MSIFFVGTHILKECSLRLSRGPPKQAQDCGTAFVTGRKPGRSPPGLGRRDTGSPPNKMSSMDAGDFIVPSPETLTFEDEQPSFAQKHPLVTCHEKVSDDDLIPLREKRRATLKPAQLDMNDTENDSESEEEESSSDSSEEDEGGHAQLPEESST